MKINRIITTAVLGIGCGLLQLTNVSAADASPHRLNSRYSNTGLIKVHSPQHGFAPYMRHRQHRHNFSRFNSRHGFGVSQHSRVRERGRNYDIVVQGFRDGRLSHAERNELRDKQREIQRMRSSFLRDGYLSSKEKRKLKNAHKDFRSSLKHELNDGERRRY